jgi:hypothetical protein
VSSLALHRGPRLAIAILIAMVLAVSWALHALYSAYAGNAAALAGKRLLLQRTSAMAAQESRVSAWSAEIFERAGDGVLLVGNDPSVTAAALQSRLAGIAEASGSTVTSFRQLEPVVKDGFLDVGVGLDLRGKLDDIREVLAAIETSRPQIRISKAAFRAEGRGGAEAEEPMLDVRLEVHGVLKPVASDEAAH